ncbi:MAG: hybrid sensor histidine kinase/response regulator [Alphaproteobacteria bacterium]|nr:hybrid sensor histidine kinase/response regulator [Alphaproteobacteria bacterium]
MSSERGMRDELIFRDEAEGEAPALAPPWPLLVIDDDAQVLAMTRVLMRDITFDGRPFEVLGAASAAEGAEILVKRPDIPVILLDVVMETDHAGLDLARRIRDEIGNHRVRIILRTGQPGEAPERDVVLAYDINDYKSKAELTAQKLFTSVIGALRSWRDIVAVERHRLGLERILERSEPLLRQRSIEALAAAFAEELRALLDSPLARVTAHRASEGWSSLPAADARLLDEAAEGGRNVFRPDAAVVVLPVLDDAAILFLLRRPEPIGPDEARLIALFAHRVTVGFDNARLYESLERRVESRTQALSTANARLAEALAAEQEAKRTQRAFLSMVSHEFRTPLAVVDSAAQMMLLSADAAHATRLGVIRGSVRRMVELIESCLSDEQLESGRLHIAARPVEPAALLRELIERNASAFPGHTFALELGALPERISVDPDHLGLALVNLMSNAAKYSRPPARVTINARREGRDLAIRVADQGIGIPAAELCRIFERFYRATNTVGVTGSGLGLHLVREIASLHGGTVEAASRLGEGTEITIRLPGG